MCDDEAVTAARKSAASGTVIRDARASPEDAMFSTAIAPFTFDWPPPSAQQNADGCVRADARRSRLTPSMAC